MLTNTFCHIPGIGLRTEQKLWDEGIRSWDDFLEMGEMALPGAKGRRAAEHLYRSHEALDDRDIPFFTASIPPAEQWRLFSHFRSRLAYIDIETTGLSASEIGGGITTIALYDGGQVRHYVQGENLRDFKDDIFEYDVLVSYNGKCFDIPFIESYFMLSLPHAHIDLRYILHSLGYRGGLKGCEKQLGIDRGDLEGVDGFFAVLLWNDYQNNNNLYALDTLLSYNIQDTINLERLMFMAYNLKVAETPFGGSHEMDVPEPPENPFIPDLGTIEALKERYLTPSSSAWNQAGLW